MVAGGVGLAPFATLAEALAARGTVTHLFYGARTGADLYTQISSNGTAPRCTWPPRTERAATAAASRMNLVRLADQLIYYIRWRSCSCLSTRRATSNFTNRCSSACFVINVQSNHLFCYPDSRRCCYHAGFASFRRPWEPLGRRAKAS